MNLTMDTGGHGRPGAPRDRLQGKAAGWQKAVQHNEDDGLSFRNLVTTAWGRKWTLLAFTLAVAALSGIHAKQQTPLYTATASVVLETASEQVFGFESVVSQSSPSYYTLNTEIEEFRAPGLMERVIDRLDLMQDPEFNPVQREPKEPLFEWRDLPYLGDLLPAKEEPSGPPPLEKQREMVIDGLLSRLSVVNMTGSYIFNLSIQTTSPEKSERIANTLAEQYIQQTRDMQFAVTKDAMDWLSDRVVDLKRELEEAERAVETSPLVNSVVSEQALTALSTQLNGFRDRLLERRETAAEARAEAETLRELRAEGNFTGIAAASNIPQIEALARELALDSSDDTRLARFDALLDRRIEELRMTADRAEQATGSLEKIIVETEAELEQKSEDLVALRQLQREAEASRLIYEYSLGRLKEISVQQGIQSTEARVLKPARLPLAASSPDVPGKTVQGGLIGLALGLAFVFGSAALRTTMRSTDEVRDLFGLPVIGVIPRGPRSKPQAVLSEIIERPSSALSEAVRNLRTAIQLSNIDVPPKVVMMTSSVAAEGKTILSISLAQSMAMSGHKVLLIDADLRRRLLGKYTDIKSEKGLVSVLAHRAELEAILVRDERTGLDILPGERVSTSATDLFSSQAFGHFIEEMRERYDYIVIDTPPVLAVPESRVIAQAVDATIYAIKWDSTTKRMVSSGLELLQQVNSHITGFVLTQVDAKKMGEFGYYGYGRERGGSGMSKYYSSS